MSDSIIEEVLKELEKLGLRVRRRVTVKGIAGFNYCFDVVIENSKSGKKVALMYIDEVDARHVLPILACRVDTDMRHIVITHQANTDALTLLNEAKVDVLITSSKYDARKLANKIIELMR